VEASSSAEGWPHEVGGGVPWREGKSARQLQKITAKGAVGTIVRRWGKPNYAAVEVRFDGGRSELFWRHELEEIQEGPQGNFAWLRWG
jgi:hypothetical protein